MAELDYNVHGQQVLSLDWEDCALLLIYIGKAIVQAEKKVEHYYDLICDGYGTPSQEDLYTKWEDTVSQLKKIYQGMLDISSTVGQH